MHIRYISRACNPLTVFATNPLTVFATKALATISTIAILLAVAACGQSNSAADSSALKKVTFMLYWTPDTNHIGIYVAKHKGWFQDAGIDIDIVPVAQAGGEQAVNNGQADFALTTLTNVSTYAIKGAKLKEVMQVQQKPSAIWCSLASNTAITSPKDFDGKTFATFGSNESDAVVRRMIQTDGGTGEFDKVTVGTSTFQTLSSGKADFGGFYSTWEGVQADMEGPALTCFAEPDYGVPGNADSIGIITSDKLIKSNPALVKKFVAAAQKGYRFAYEHPNKASELLVEEASDANLDIDFVKKSMKFIVDGQYWGDLANIKDGSFTLGTIDFSGTQAYFDFLAQEDAYSDADGQTVHTAPQSNDLATNKFLSKG